MIMIWFFLKKFKDLFERENFIVNFGSLLVKRIKYFVIKYMSND